MKHAHSQGNLRRDMETLCGIMKEKFSINALEESNRSENAAARAMICAVLAEHGYPKARIGVTLGWTYETVRYYSRVVMPRIIRNKAYFYNIWTHFRSLAKEALS